MEKEAGNIVYRENSRECFWSNIKKNLRIIIAVLCIAIAVFIITLLRAYVFDLIIIKGDSMFPALMQNDHVILNKLAYRNQAPKRGDIISAKLGYRRIVKRVIGIPGDVIEFKDGILYCSGKTVGTAQSKDSHSHNPSPYFRRPRMIQSRHVFIIGDNMDVSLDSRDYGTIPYQDIVGKVIFIYFPPKRIGKLL